MRSEPPVARLTVRPGRPLSGRFEPPGDKSITHRAYVLGLLASGRTEIENPNPGADCEATLTCAGRLGARWTRSDETVRIDGCAMNLREPEGVLDCGNSGTTLRLLAGPLAAQPFLSVLAGDASLHRRPVDRVIDPLRRMGSQLWARDGDRLPPLAIRGGALSPITYRLPIPSAQLASCILLAGLFAPGTTRIEIPGAARDHTQRMLGAFGIEVDDDNLTASGSRGATRSIAVTGPARATGIRLRVPGDFSAAAFFLAAAAATPGSRVTAEGVTLNPTRTGLLEVLERMGARVERTRRRDEGGEPVGDVTVMGPERLVAAEIPGDEVPAMIDEVPAWVIAAASAEGTSRVAGASELRIKESDRLQVLATNLVRLGVAVEETRDGLAVTGGAVKGGTVDAAGDHRIAMAFAVLATRASGPVTVADAASIVTSYPGFVRTLVGLGGTAEAMTAPPHL